MLSVNSDFLKFWSAAIFLRHNPLAWAAFEVLSKNLGISGFGIARKLDTDPVMVEQALALLREMQMISGCADLRDNLTLTETGFGVREIIRLTPSQSKWSNNNASCSAI